MSLANLKPLIRVRKHAVEQKQKFLAELYRQAEELAAARLRAQEVDPGDGGLLLALSRSVSRTDERNASLFNGLSALLSRTTHHSPEEPAADLV